MRILFVGSLAWNPERIRSLAERGHELWGVWTRSMAWDQGPYPALEGCVRPVALRDAASVVREERIDCIYSLFQVYRRRLWAPPAPGVEHDLWTALRALLRERQRGAFEAPIVRHWGFDVHNLDLGVARALDGHVFCNRQKLEYWSAPQDRGGCGLDVFGDCEVVDFLDSDRPKQEFMGERFSTPLSEANGELHTVCIGRPFNIDYVAAARHGVHVHVYGNSFDDLYRTVSRDLSSRALRRIAGYLHLHASRQMIGADWAEVRRVKSRWVEEFSRYDAGWSYLGNPLAWPPLEDRAAMPNRVGTYLLAGLPVITDPRPGSYRYEELRRTGAAIELVDSDYGDLRARLETERRTRQARRNAREARQGYSFDATIDRLAGVLERARESYYSKPHAERSRFPADGGGELVHFGPSLPRRVLAERRRLLVPLRRRRLARHASVR